MFGLGSHSQDVVAVVDIGSGSAGAAVMLRNGKGAASIVAAERAILPLEERTRDQTIKGLTTMITDSLTHVLKSYAAGDIGRHGPPQAVYVVVRAPWTRASSGYASKIFQKEETITKKLINDIAAEAMASDKELDKANILETSVIRVELNEYQTAHPIGRRAHRLKVVTFESDFDPVMHKAVTDAIEAILPHKKQTVHSGARVYLSIVQNLIEHPSDYVILDMVSEATSIMSVREGIITQHAVIDEGVRTILRRISGEEGLPDETLHLIRMVVAGSCSGEECEKLNAALTKVEPVLVKTFGEAVGSFVSKQRLPDNLIINAHPDITVWLQHLFSRLDFAQFTVSMRPFNVRVIKPEDIYATAMPIPGVAADTGISVACAFVNTEIAAS